MTKKSMNKVIDAIRNGLPSGSQLKIAESLKCSSDYVNRVLTHKIAYDSTDLTKKIVELALELKKQNDLNQKELNKLLSDHKA